MDQKTRRPIQKLDLEHWFVNYQLERIRKDHFHFPSSIDVDVTSLLSQYPNEKPTSVFTSLLVKAVGQILADHPETNKIFFKTFFGPRIVTPPYIAVNLPLQLEYKGKKVISAMLIENPHLKSIEEIKAEIKQAREKGLQDKPITRFVAQRSNNFFNRMLLKTLILLGTRFPELYLRRKAGGVAVTSLLHEGKHAGGILGIGYGNTAFTVGITSLWQNQGRWLTKIGIGNDHLAVPGYVGMMFAKRLMSLLENPQPVQKSSTQTFTEIPSTTRSPDARL